MTVQSNSIPPSFLIALVQSCSLKRFKLAVDALSEEASPVVLTHVSDAAVRALVASGDKEYGVTLTASLSTCSCKDYSYRGEVCKHQILTALHAIRTPAPQPEVEVPAVALPIPVDVAPVVVSPLPCLCWSDGLTVCGSFPTNRVHRYPWNQVMLEGACRECLMTYKRGYHNSHMIHVMTHKAAA